MQSSGCAPQPLAGDQGRDRGAHQCWNYLASLWDHLDSGWLSVTFPLSLSEAGRSLVAGPVLYSSSAVWYGNTPLHVVGIQCLFNSCRRVRRKELFFLPSFPVPLNILEKSHVLLHRGDSSVTPHNYVVMIPRSSRVWGSPKDRDVEGSRLWTAWLETRRQASQKMGHSPGEPVDLMTFYSWRLWAGSDDRCHCCTLSNMWVTQVPIVSLLRNVFSLWTNLHGNATCFVHKC